MLIKFTNLNYKTTTKSRKKQNRSIHVPDNIGNTWSDADLKWYFERIVANGNHWFPFWNLRTTHETKVIRNFDPREFYQRLYTNRRNRRLAKQACVAQRQSG